MDIDKIVEKLKKDTNEASDITYRMMVVNKRRVWVIYIEALTSSDKISDFIIRSLNGIDKKYAKQINLRAVIKNDISNFKITSIYDYENICYYLNNGFTILLIENSEEAFGLETKRNLARGISAPATENSMRGPMDCFVEDFQTNMGLIRRRIKDNNLWISEVEIGRYTKTKVGLLYVNGVANEELVKTIQERLKKIDIYGVLNSGTIKNLVEKENKSVFPTVLSTERPDRVCQALLRGKIVILVDSSPFCLILPTTLKEFFLAPDDTYGKSLNISFTRIIRYLAFFISLFTPSVYIALTTFNQEILPTDLLINFAAQRSSVPFPAFIEALLMMVSFEILKESDLIIPSFSGSALSIVGALILGEAAVSAGIVSPIMIIVIAITAISALPFSEPEITNGLRWYRLLFMLGASALGIYGVVITFIYFVIRLCSVNSFDVPYSTPFSPLFLQSLKNSFIKFPVEDLKQRDAYISDNKVQLNIEEEK